MSWTLVYLESVEADSLQVVNVIHSHRDIPAMFDEMPKPP